MRYRCLGLQTLPPLPYVYVCGPYVLCLSFISTLVPANKKVACCAQIFVISWPHRGIFWNTHCVLISFNHTLGHWFLRLKRHEAHPQAGVGANLHWIAASGQWPVEEHQGCFTHLGYMVVWKLRVLLLADPGPCSKPPSYQCLQQAYKH